MDENSQSEQHLLDSVPAVSMEDPRVHGLSDLKLRAVEMLVAGVRPGVVAQRLGVSRETIWRWRREPSFRRHVQRLRVELHASRIDRTWALVDKSLDVVEEHLDEGDLQAALTLLKLARFDPTTALPDGPEDEAPSDAEGS
jgi:hypothetical protein